MPSAHALSVFRCLTAPFVLPPPPHPEHTPVQVVREAYPDLTAQDKSSKYHDPKATADDPRWSMVDFKLVSQEMLMTGQLNGRGCCGRGGVVVGGGGGKGRVVYGTQPSARLV
jgi:hypothetical protein